MSGMSSTLVEPRAVSPPEVRLQKLTNIVVDVDDAIPIKRYFRSSNEMIRMAKYYLDEGNLEKSFQLYMKHIVLYVERLPKHVDYKTADVADKEAVKRKCAQIISTAEKLKDKIRDKYTLQYDDYLKSKETYERALKLQQAEQDRLAKARQEEQDKRRKASSDTFVSSLQSQIDRKKLELIEKKTRPEGRGEEEDEDDEDEEDNIAVVPTAPMAELTLDDEDNNAGVPTVDRSTKPSLVSEMDSDQLSEELTRLVIPFKSITSRFTSAAYSNTSRNIETCGILAGRLHHGRFMITHVMLPKQSGTSDSCTAMNEEELAFEQERLDLITLGWIHTHPSQKSFLSSIDLHTHAPYQKMLPEAVAIVVAPSYGETGLYSLSDWGLQFILACKQTGFHPHSNESDIYGAPGHVVLDAELSVELIDFR